MFPPEVIKEKATAISTRTDYSGVRVRSVMATVMKRKPTEGEKRKISYAALNGDINAIKVLASSGVDVTGIVGPFNWTALHFAADNGHYNVVAYLLSHGAGVNDVAGGNITALHCAATKGHYNVVAYLLSHGARVNDVDFSMDTPLHLAARYGCAQIVDLLVKNEANISMKNSDNRTPLQEAIVNGKSQIVSFFVHQLKTDITKFDKGTQDKIRRLLEEAQISKKDADSVNNHFQSPDPSAAGVSVDTQLVKGAVVISQIIDKQSTPTMQDLNRYVIKKYAANWEDIGLELGLSLYTLEIFSKNNQKECVSCFRSTLNEWLNLNPSATWSMLEVAITNVRRTSNGLDPVTDVYGTS